MRIQGVRRAWRIDPPSVQPLEDVRQELELILSSALSK